MNWVGGARNRIKLKHERKIQKEFFERKRHNKKVIRDENSGKNRPERGERKGISQDLIALQALVSAHDKKPIPREVRKPFAVNLDEPKRTGRDVHRRSYAVELPESPRSSSTSFGKDKELTNEKKDMACNNGKLFDSASTKLSLQMASQHLTKSKNVDDSQHEPNETLTKIPDRKPFTLNTWTDIPTPNRPQQQSEYTTFSITTEDRDRASFNINQKMLSPKKTITFQQLQPLGKEPTFTITSYNEPDKNYSELLSQECTTETIDAENVARNSKKRSIPTKSIGGDTSILMSAFRPFNKITTPCELKEATDCDKFKTPKTLHKSLASSDSTKSFSPSSQSCIKPLPMDIPMQTWTSHKVKDKHWNHFNVYPGHQTKNLFIDKESVDELSVKHKNIKNDIVTSPRIALLKSEQSLLERKVTPDRTVKPNGGQWNPFNISCPVKVEPKGVSVMGTQEAAWRTFLRGSGRFQMADGLDTQYQLQKKDPRLFLTPSTVKVDAERNAQIEEIEERGSSGFDHEGKTTLHKNEALQEVMDMDRDEDGQSSGFTSSWSTFSDDEPDADDDGCTPKKDNVSIGVSKLEEVNKEMAAQFSGNVCHNSIESSKPVSAADSAILSPAPSLEQQNSANWLECKEMCMDFSPEKENIGMRRRKVKKCLFPCKNGDEKISKDVNGHFGITRNDVGNSRFEGIEKKSVQNESQSFTGAKHPHLDYMPKTKDIHDLEGNNTCASSLCEGVTKNPAAMHCLSKNDTETLVHSPIDVNRIHAKKSPCCEKDRKPDDKRAPKQTTSIEYSSMRTPESIDLFGQLEETKTKHSLFEQNIGENGKKAEKSTETIRTGYSSEEMEDFLGASTEHVESSLCEGLEKNVNKKAQKSTQTDCASYTNAGVQTDKMSTSDPSSDLLPANVDDITEDKNTSCGHTLVVGAGKDVKDPISRSSDSWLDSRVKRHCSDCHDQKDVNWYLSVLVNIFQQEN